MAPLRNSHHHLSRIPNPSPVADHSPADISTRIPDHNDNDAEHAHGNTRSAAPPDAPVTAALSTPHDAVLAELQGSRAGTSHPTTNSELSRNPPRLSVIPTIGSLERTERTASPSAGARSATSTPAISHEPVFDPFSGNLAGLMAPRKDSERDAATAVAALQFDQRRDELWSRLSSIRELQSEVAGMHVQMEGIGLNDLRGGKRAPGVGRVHSDTIPVAEEWDGSDGAADAVEEQRKRARDAEFTNLAETFKGRREAIDAIMGKLGELSDALTAFHDLPTPVVDLGNSRNNTKDSTPFSPDFANTTSPSLAASPSPELPPALPKFILSEADKLHESPITAPGELPPHAFPA